MTIRDGGADDFAIPDYGRVVDAVDLNPYLGRGDSEADKQISDPVVISHSTPPLFALRDLLLDPRFIDMFARALRATGPEIRELIPRESRPILEKFVQAFTYALTTTEEAAGDHAKVAEVMAFATELGADHHKLNLSAQHYQSFGTALAATLQRLAGSSWSEKLDTTLSTAYRVLTAAMQSGAEQSTAQRIGATVVAVDRPTRDVTVVRLIADEMLDYLPGQYLSVLTPYVQAMWRRLSPAIPANPAKQLEFHIRDVPGGALSGAIVRGVSVGDRWVVADALGTMEIDRSEPFRDVLMIAGGTGIAPLRCMLFDIQRFADNPRVHLFYGARYPGELYDLPTLVEISSHSPWFTIQPVAEEDSDPWWMSQNRELPRTLHQRQTGKLVDVVSSYGTWADRQIFVCGSPAMVRATVTGLVAAGTPREIIQFDRP